MSLLLAALLTLGEPPAPPPVVPAAVVQAQEAPVPTAVSYAERERMAADLEQFRGGSEGLIILIVVVVAVLVLIAIILPW